ncbi:hypothetical protein KAR10_08140, partial [bacterium]|nr:hypothetical protein [bacterium]
NHHKKYMQTRTDYVRTRRDYDTLENTLYPVGDFFKWLIPALGSPRIEEHGFIPLFTAIVLDGKNIEDFKSSSRRSSASHKGPPYTILTFFGPIGLISMYTWLLSDKLLTGSSRIVHALAQLKPKGFLGSDRFKFAPNEFINQRHQFLDRHPVIRRGVVMPLLGLILSLAQTADALGFPLQPYLASAQVENINNYEKIREIKLSRIIESKFGVPPNAGKERLRTIADRIIFKPFDAQGPRGRWQNFKGLLFGYSHIYINEAGKIEIHMPHRLLAALDISDTPGSGLAGNLSQLAEAQLLCMLEHQTALRARLLLKGNSLQQFGLNLVEEVIFYNELAALEEEQKMINLDHDPKNSMGQILRQKEINVGPAEIIRIYVLLMKKLDPAYRLINADEINKHMSLDMADKELIAEARKNEDKNLLAEYPYWADQASILNMLSLAKKSDKLINAFLKGFAGTNTQEIADMGAAALIINELAGKKPLPVLENHESRVTQLNTLALPPEAVNIMLKAITEDVIRSAAEEQGFANELIALRNALQQTRAALNRGTDAGQIISFNGNIAQRLTQVLSWQYAFTESEVTEIPGINIAQLGKQIETEKEIVFAVAASQIQSAIIKVSGKSFRLELPLVGQIKAESQDEAINKLNKGEKILLPFNGSSRINISNKQNALQRALDKVLYTIGMLLLKYLPALAGFETHLYLLKISPLDYIQSQVPAKVMEHSPLARQLLETGGPFQELCLQMATARNRREYYQRQKAFVNYMRKYLALYYYDIYGDQVRERPEELRYVSKDKMQQNYWNLQFFHKLMIL